MNLVAQEMVLCQDAIEGLAGEYRGALVLSEYAGVAQYLSRALLVNPWDIERTADALERALRMSAGEKRERLRTMIAQVDEMDSRRWADLFLLQVARSAQRSRARAQRNLRARDLDTLCGRFEAARGRILILDYDGTLREITREPEEAEPTDEIRALLSGLAALRGCEVHVVSGRDRATLDAWLDDLRIWLCAEHGYCSRPPAGAWEVRHDVELSWKPAVARMLGSAAAEVPGTRVESKSCALAWHARASCARRFPPRWPTNRWK
jgi:trehalose 6-phosphate synthase/phosphatase